MSALPSGIVTFLFTDIEGSTSLLKRLGDRYPNVLEEHHGLLRELCGRFGGVEVDNQGDAFFFVFARARDAVSAAVESQRALAAQTWPDDVAVRVRMGIHSGEATATGSGYVGLAVHRAARIAAAAAGRQVLLSGSTYGLLGDEALPEVDLNDLGERELKDLDRPERLYEALAAGAEGARGSGGPLRLVIADDSMLLREGLARLLADAGFDVAATACDADELLRAVDAARPAVALTDIKMPPTHSDEGLVAAEQIRKQHPDIGVLVLSQYLESRYAMRLLEHYPERAGYLLKDRISDVAVLGDAIRRVAEGECVVDPTIVSRLMNRARRDGPLATLAEEELELLSLIGEGRSDEAIAQRLGRDVAQVQADAAGVFEKLEIEGSPDELRRIVSVLNVLRT